MSRLSAIALSIGCVLMGFTFANTRVSARADDVQVVRRLPYTVNSGDRVTLTYATGSFGTGPSVVECTVKAEGGGWVLCSNDDPATATRDQHWYDLTRVVEVKREAR